MRTNTDEISISIGVVFKEMEYPFLSEMYPQNNAPKWTMQMLKNKGKYVNGSLIVSLKISEEKFMKIMKSYQIQVSPTKIAARVLLFM